MQTNQQWTWPLKAHVQLSSYNINYIMKNSFYLKNSQSSEDCSTISQHRTEGEGGAGRGRRKGEEHRSLLNIFGC